MENSEERNVRIEYGIPGNMIPLKSIEDIDQVEDPLPKMLKQIVCTSSTGKTIQYEQRRELIPHKILTLPLFQLPPQCNKFLFYCHAPDIENTIYDINYKCFIEHAWPEARDDPTFFVCIMHNVEQKFGFSWPSPNTIVIRRPNLSLDFGSFTDALHFLDIDTLFSKSNDAKMLFFFLNSTVFGPSLPWWMRGKLSWTQIFADMITNDVKLAGMTINCFRGRPHVQSMVLVTDEIGLAIGLKAQVFARRIGKNQVIEHSEVGFSAAILAAGFNIDCTCEALHGYDFRDLDVVARIPLKDVCFERAYNGFSLHPFECIFTKTNRMGLPLAQFLQSQRKRLEEKKQKKPIVTLKQSISAQFGKYLS